MLNIKQIVHKIILFGDLNPVEYTTQQRLDDVNELCQFYRAKIYQIGSHVPMRKTGEVITETFTLVEGTNVFTRTIPDVPFFRMDYSADGLTGFRKIFEDPKRIIEGLFSCGMKFFADDKTITVENAQAGTLRVTYVAGNFIPYTMSDYNAGTPPTPDFIPETYRPLLYMKPAMVMAGFYKKDRFPQIKNMVEELENLFYNEYKRDSVPLDLSLSGEKFRGCGDGVNNGRR